MTPLMKGHSFEREGGPPSVMSVRREGGTLCFMSDYIDPLMNKVHLVIQPFLNQSSLINCNLRIYEHET